MPVAVAYVNGRDNLKVLNENQGAEQYGIAFRDK